jgi:hypothetical protein
MPGATRMSGLHAIVCTSVAGPIERTRLIAALETARRICIRRGVTGVLFHHAGQLFQYLEGPEDAIRRIFARMLQSQLHCALRTLLDAPLSARHFASYHLGFCEPAQSEFEASANAEWIRAMPLTRTTFERSESLSLVLSYWSRWVADQPERPRLDVPVSA